MNPIVRGFGESIADHMFLSNIGAKTHEEIERCLGDLTADVGVLSAHVTTAEGGLADVTSLAMDTDTDLKAHTGTTTQCPHAGQDLRATATPTFAGLTLVGTAQCSAEPVNGNSLINKQYVDNLMSYSQTWQKAVRAFHDFSGGNPADLVEGDRFIATATSGAFTQHRIYTWTNLAWVEATPLVGYCLYDAGTDANYIFVQAGSWARMSLSLDHNDLFNRGTVSHTALDAHVTGAVKTHAEIDTHITGAVKTHSEIDTHIAATTQCPHSGQDLRSTADPTFNTLTLTESLDSPAVVASSGDVGQLTVSESLTCSPGCSVDLGTLAGPLTISNPDVSSATLLRLFQPNLGANQFSTIMFGRNYPYHHFRLEYTDTPSNPYIQIRRGDTEMVFRISDHIVYSDMTFLFGHGGDSSAPYLGSVRMLGGLGVMKSVTVGGSIATTSSDDSTDVYSGAIKSNGGLGVVKKATIGGTTTITDATDSTSTTTGALIISGGVGVAKTLRANAGISETRLSVLNTTATGGVTPLLMTCANQVDGSASTVVLGKAWSAGKCGMMTYTHAGDSSTSNSLKLNINGSVGLKVTPTGTVVENTTAASSTTTGALTVTGGIGCGGNLHVGGDLVADQPYQNKSTYSGCRWGGIGTPQVLIAGNLHIRRAGNAIQLCCGVRVTDLNAANYSYIALLADANTAFVLPTEYRPKYNTYSSIMITDNVTMQTAAICIDANGHIALYSCNKANFTGLVTIFPFCANFYAEPV